MKNLLKRIFRRKLKALVVLSHGAVSSKALQILKEWARDNNAAIIAANHPDGIRILSIGPESRVLVPKSISDKDMRRIAESKPGQILKIDEPVEAA